MREIGTGSHRGLCSGSTGLNPMDFANLCMHDPIRINSIDFSGFTFLNLQNYKQAEAERHTYKEMQTMLKDRLLSFKVKSWAIPKFRLVVKSLFGLLGYLYYIMVLNYIITYYFFSSPCLWKC